MSKKTRRLRSALLSSVVAMILCFSMLLGTTYAWFTDSVTSAGNIIKSGTLEVTMEWAEGIEEPASATWTDASAGPIFKYDLWEPGYAEVRHIKIENKGTLALKYQINIFANGAVSDLADVIDVYYVDPAVQVTGRGDLIDDYKLDTLTKVLANVSNTASGNLAAGESHTITIALKMQESAGNDYQDKSIGSDFSVKLLATQLTAESDSFGNDYDEDAGFLPIAKVERASEYENKDLTWGTYGQWSPTAGLDSQLEAAYTFTCDDTPEEAEDSPYADWYCDFYVKLDRDLGEDEIFLGGNYGTFGWVGFHNGNYTLEANKELPLLGSVTTIPWTYLDVATNVGTFICGVGDVDDALSGATFTVMLRLTNPDDEAEFYNVATINYTFE